MFATQSIRQISTTVPTVYAFAVSGHVTDDDAEELAEFMNDVFDKHDDVNMLMQLSDYAGSDKDALFDGDVIKSRWRSLFKVKRYAVVGAPKNAASLISFMDKILPVKAKAFDSREQHDAWSFVGALAA